MCFAAFGLSPSINSPWFTVIPCVSRVLLLSVPFCRILFAVIICCITLTLSAYRYSPTIASTFKLTVAVAPFLSHIPDGVHVLPFYVIVPDPRFIPHPPPDACFPARVVRRPTPWVRDPPLPHTHLCLRECPLDCIFVTRLFTGEPSPTHMHDYLQLHTYPHPLPRPEAYKYTRSIRVTVAPGRCPAAPSSRSTIHDSRPSRLHTTHLHLHHYWHNCSRVPCRFRARYGLPTPATPAFAARCALRTTVASRAHHSDDGVPPPRGTRRNFTGRRSRPLALSAPVPDLSTDRAGAGTAGARVWFWDPGRGPPSTRRGCNLLVRGAGGSCRGRRGSTASCVALACAGLGMLRVVALRAPTPRRTVPGVGASIWERDARKKKEGVNNVRILTRRRSV